jgi:cysteine-rich repeat protein
VHPWGVAIVTGSGSCGNGVLDAGEQCDDGNTRDGDRCSARCRKAPAFAVIRLQLDDLSDAVAARVLIGSLRASLVKSLDRVGPAMQLAEDRVEKDAVRAAKKRLAKALRALHKFDKRLDSRAGRQLDPLSSTTRPLLHDMANALRTAIHALRDALE